MEYLIISIQESNILSRKLSFCSGCIINYKLVTFDGYLGTLKTNSIMADKIIDYYLALENLVIQYQIK